MAKYKKCPGCNIDLKHEVPLCYVCNRVQPGFEGATEADRDRFDDALFRKNELEDRPKGALIAIIVGWLLVFLLISLYLLINQNLIGPGGPPG